MLVKMINLFNLHSKYDSPDSWIWAYLEVNQIKKIYFSLLKSSTQKDIARRINSKLNAGLSTIEKHLIKIKKSYNNLYLPLPLIIELNNLADKDYRQELLKSIIALESKNYNSQAVKPVQQISETLAKIIGAHVSDGYLQKDKKGLYAWKVTEAKKDLINKLAIWIKDVFGFQVRIWYYSRDNMWVCSSKNKIFCRFLEKIIGIPSGKKAYTIKEPDIIKKSDISIRNAFLAGMLNFDGCVKTNGVISLTSMSENLIKDVKDIFDKNNIKTNIIYNKNKKSWLIETSFSRDRKSHKKLLNFFESGTYKHNKLKFFVDNKKYSLTELVKIFPEEKKSKISLKKVYQSTKGLKQFKVHDLLKDINKNNNISKTTLYKYLYILIKSGILSKQNKQIFTDKNAYFETTYSFVNTNNNNLKTGAF